MKKPKCMLCVIKSATIKKEVLIPVPGLYGTFRNTGLYIEVCKTCYPTTMPVIINDEENYG